MSSWEEYDWTAEDCLEQLAFLMKNKQSVVPDLKYFTYQIESSSVDWSDDEQDALRDICEDASVRWEILNFHSPQRHLNEDIY